MSASQAAAEPQFRAFLSQLLNTRDELAICRVEHVDAMPLPQAQHIAEVMGGIGAEMNQGVFAKDGCTVQSRLAHGWKRRQVEQERSRFCQIPRTGPARFSE